MVEIQEKLRKIGVEILEQGRGIQGVSYSYFCNYKIKLIKGTQDEIKRLQKVFLSELFLISRDCSIVEDTYSEYKKQLSKRVSLSQNKASLYMPSTKNFQVGGLSEAKAAFEICIKLEKENLQLKEEAERLSLANKSLQADLDAAKEDAMSRKKSDKLKLQARVKELESAKAELEVLEKEITPKGRKRNHSWLGLDS